MACDNLSATNIYLAGNDLRIEPGESTQFLVEATNPHDTDCTVYASIYAGDANDTSSRHNLLAGESAVNVSAGDSELLGDTHSWDEITSEAIGTSQVPPGEYNMFGVVKFRDENDVQREDVIVWEDNNGNPITIKITDENGEMPSDEPDINITDLVLSNQAPDVGDEIDAHINATNSGGADGTKSFDIRVDGSKVGAVEFSINPGDTKSATATLKVSEAGSHTVSVGSQSTTYSAEGNVLVEITDMNVSTGTGSITVDGTYVNNGSVTASFYSTITVTKIVDGQPSDQVSADTQDIILSPGETKTIHANVDVGVEPETQDDFEVCLGKGGVIKV